MQRTNSYYWPAAPHRHLGDNFASTGRDLLLARRRKQQKILRAAAYALLALFSVIIVVAGAGKGVPFLRTAFGGAQEQIILPIVMTPPQQQQEQVQQPVRPVRILLLGSDQRGDDRSYRTDVIVLVTVDTANYTASAVSFPRDLWVEPPALYPMKINMVHALGGFDAMAGMFESNFGVRPDYYVLTNFNGFASMIDNIGGIDVHVHEPLKDSCDLPQAPGGICDIYPGVQTMDGATALWYVRSRETTSDYDRLRRAQEVVQAVFERMMNMNALLNLPMVYSDLTQYVETNIGLEDVAPLVPAASRLFQDPSRIQRHAITEAQATPSWSWDGMWILLPDYELIGQMLEEAGAR